MLTDGGLHRGAPVVAGGLHQPVEAVPAVLRVRDGRVQLPRVDGPPRPLARAAKGEAASRAAPSEARLRNPRLGVRADTSAIRVSGKACKLLRASISNVSGSAVILYVEYTGFY